jgi:hypothetical protein
MIFLASRRESLRFDALLYPQAPVRLGFVVALIGKPALGPHYAAELPVLRHAANGGPRGHVLSLTKSVIKRDAASGRAGQIIAIAALCAARGGAQFT